MGIRVNQHETLTLGIEGAELTVNTGELFKAWMDKFIFKRSPGQQLITSARPGERYVTSIMQPDGRMRHVFLLPGEAKKNWNDGMAWAKEKGGDLPDRIVFAFLKTYMPEEFKKETYWMNEQPAGISDYAWCQGFSIGGQNYDSKDDEFRVRAVRSEFSDSVI